MQTNLFNLIQYALLYALSALVLMVIIYGMIKGIVKEKEMRLRNRRRYS